MAASEPGTASGVPAESEGAHDHSNNEPLASLDSIKDSLPPLSPSTQIGPILTRSQSAPVIESDSSGPESPQSRAPAPHQPTADEQHQPQPHSEQPRPSPTAPAWAGSALGLQHVGLPVAAGVPMGAVPLALEAVWPPGIVAGERRRGACKFFNATKGFGFIVDDKPEMAGVEVFVHYTAIDAVQAGPEGFRALADGEKVEYTITQGPKGWQAQNVSGPNGAPCIGPPPRSSQHYQNTWNQHNTVPGPRGAGVPHQLDDRQHKHRRQSLGAQSAQGSQPGPAGGGGGGGGPKAYQRRNRNDSGFWSAGMASPGGPGMSPGGYGPGGPYSFSPSGIGSAFSSPIQYQSFPASPAFGTIPLGVVPPWAAAPAYPGSPPSEATALGAPPAPGGLFGGGVYPPVGLVQPELQHPAAGSAHPLSPRPASTAPGEQVSPTAGTGSFQWSQGIAPGAASIASPPGGWIPPPPPPPGWDPEIYHQQHPHLFVQPPHADSHYAYPSLAQAGAAVDPSKFGPPAPAPAGMVQPWVGAGDEQHQQLLATGELGGGEQQ